MQLSVCAALFREIQCADRCLGETEENPATPKRRIRRVSTLMALPMYPQRTASTQQQQTQYPTPKRALLDGADGRVESENEDDLCYNNRPAAGAPTLNAVM